MHINYHTLNSHALISTVMYSDHYSTGAGNSWSSHSVTISVFFFEVTVGVHIKNKITTTKKNVHYTAWWPTFILTIPVTVLNTMLIVWLRIRIKHMTTSYVYWNVHHLDIWMKIDQLDVTCFIISLFNPSAWGHLNPSSYCDVGRLFYGVFKLWSKLQRKKWRNNF